MAKSLTYDELSKGDSIEIFFYEENIIRDGEVIFIAHGNHIEDNYPIKIMTMNGRKSSLCSVSKDGGNYLLPDGGVSFCHIRFKEDTDKRDKINTLLSEIISEISVIDHPAILLSEKISCLTKIAQKTHSFFPREETVFEKMVKAEEKLK